MKLMKPQRSVASLAMGPTCRAIGFARKKSRACGVVRKMACRLKKNQFPALTKTR